MLQDITRTIAPDATSIFDVAGGSLACIAANLPDFAIRFDSDSEALFRVGFEYTPPEGFRRFQVHNTRGAPLTVTFTVAEGQFRDRRQISSAPQSFLPVTLDDVVASGYRAFGDHTYVALMAVAFGNPPDSGISMIVRQISLARQLAGPIFLAFDDFSNFELAPVVRKSISVSADGTDGGINVYTADDYFADPGIGSYRLPADTSLIIPLPAPLVIPPGKVLAATGNNTTIRVVIDHIEVPAG